LLRLPAFVVGSDLRRSSTSVMAVAGSYTLGLRTKGNKLTPSRSPLAKLTLLTGSQRSLHDWAPDEVSNLFKFPNLGGQNERT
jgi:hypothetical protein